MENFKQFELEQSTKKEIKGGHPILGAACVVMAGIAIYDHFTTAASTSNASAAGATAGAAAVNGGKK